MSPSKPVMNVCYFHWDALCVESTVLFLLTPLYSPLFIFMPLTICNMRMYKAFKATSPVLSTFNESAKCVLDARELQSKRQAHVLQ